MNSFMLGAIVMCCAAIGVFFLRFWRRTHDRLFIILATAFWLLGVNWLALAITEQDELQTALYVVRFVAFLLIIVGIVDKNRSTRGAPPARAKAPRA